MGNIHYDQKSGIGSIPFNQDVGYRGFKCWMYPDMYLRLAKKIFIDPNDNYFLLMKNAIRKGKPIGSPYFDVSWDETKKVWTVWSHEGRHRVQAIKDLWPNEQVEIHIISGGGIRARDITPPMLQSFFEGVIAEDKTYVEKPTAKIEHLGKPVSPQQAAPVMETQLQKSQREAKEFEGKIGVRKNFEYFGTIKRKPTGQVEWIMEVENPDIKQRLSQAHDKLYGQFNKILKKEKPCQFDTTGQCAGSRKRYTRPGDVCCAGCEHHGEKGCTTQSLGCKAWTCPHMWPNLSPQAQKLWNKLRDKAYQSGMSGVRDTKEDEIQWALDHIRSRVAERRAYAWVKDYMKKHRGVSEEDARWKYYEFLQQNKQQDV